VQISNRIGLHTGVKGTLICSKIDNEKLSCRKETMRMLHTVASLGLVSPGRQLRVLPHFFLKKTDDLFCSSLSLLLLSLGCHPRGGCHPAPFLPDHLVRPLFFVNSPSIFFFGCHPLECVTRGGPPPVAQLAAY